MIDGGDRTAYLATSEITDPRLIYLKGVLFLFCGLVSAGMLVAFAPSVGNAALLAICVWSFARFYYFAFYVIEHYVDGKYRFAGLMSFAAYAVRRRFGWRRPDRRDTSP